MTDRKITEAQTNAVLAYLAQCKYADVFQIVGMLSNLPKIVTKVKAKKSK